MNLEQLKKAISEAFEKAAEEATKKILEECPRKEIKERAEVWKPGVIICTSVGDLAAEDYYEILEDGTKKTEFTWDEAMEIEKKTDGEWRLPTVFEWDKLVAEFGDKDGILDRNTFVNALALTEDVDRDGYYWTSTKYSSANGAYSLSFSSKYVYRDSSAYYDERAVRLVREDVDG